MRIKFREDLINTTLSKSKMGDRLWPTPDRSWAMRMNWHDLLFMHWPIECSAIRHLVPESLEVDTFDGSAWIGIVPFRMTGVAPRFSPNVPFMSRFPELNVRTYVTFNGKPGVWFFCLEATNRIAVRLARKLFHLPYMDASIRFSHLQTKDGQSWIEYRSARTHRAEPPATLKVDYRPVGESFHAKTGSIEEFLTSRYCMYAADASKRVYRGEIDHDPWVLQAGQANVKENTMTDWLGIRLPDRPPLLHYSKLVKAIAWTLEGIQN